MTEMRPLSGGMKLAIFFSAPLAWMGVIFTLVGCLLLLLSDGATDFKSPFVFSSDDPRVEGRLVGRSETRISSNKRRIHEYIYQYQVDSRNYEGRSFGTDNGVAAGGAVTVQYVAHDPATSHIEGMGLAPVGIEAALIVAIFPGIGLVMLYFTVRRYRKYSYLVEYGVFTTGKVVRKESTYARINGRTVYRVFFRYQSRDGLPWEACITTNRADDLGNGEAEPLVYDPETPEEAVLLDLMPAAIRQLVTGH